MTASKTSVDMISGNFVSDVNMAVSKSHQPGLLTASYTYDRRLSDKLPVGIKCVVGEKWFLIVTSWPENNCL